MQLTSFGYRNGAPLHTTFIVDCRAMRNPHFDPELRALTGQSEAVKDFVAADPRFNSLFDLALRYADEDNAHIAFGCFGGRHRSVAMVELLAARLQEDGYSVRINHRELRIVKNV